MAREYHIRWIEDGLLIGHNRAQAWFRLARVSCQLQPVIEYESLARRISQALEAVTPEASGLNVQLRIVRQPFDVDEWRETLDTYAQPPAGAHDMYDEYFTRMQQHLTAQQFLDTDVYLGIDIATQGATGNALGILRKWIGGIVDGNTDTPTDSELTNCRTHVDTYYRELSNLLDTDIATGVHIATPREIVWLLRKPYWDTYDCPTADIPDVDYFDDAFISTLLDERLTVGRDGITVDTDTGSFATSFASLGKYPDYMEWPQSLSWYAVATSVTPDVEVTINATIVRKKDVVKRLKDLEASVNEEVLDAAENLTSDREDLRDQESEAKDKRKRAERGDTGWVDMSVRLQLRAPTMSELTERRGRLRRALAEAGYTLITPPNMQHQLALEAMPGGTWVGLHRTSFDLDAIGASGCLLSFDVGSSNKVGPYIGHTTLFEHRPVFFNPNFACQTNEPPGTIVVGQPGRGKTSLSLTLAFQSFLMGHTTLFVDPKADTDRLATWLGPEFVNYIDMTREQAGLLDPFFAASGIGEGNVSAAEIAEMAQNSVMGVVTTLLGIRDDRAEKNTISEAITDVIEAAKNGGRPACMNALVDHLLTGDKHNSRALGAQLRGYASNAYGRLLFSDGNVALQSPKGKFTIITLNGLAIPDPELDRNEYQEENLVALAVMYLVMMYAQRLMMSDALSQRAGARIQTRKTIFLDEAWSVFATKEGRAAASSILRLGRSMGTGSVFISQRLTDIPDASKYASSIFAFGCANEDVDDYIRILDLETTPEFVKKQFGSKAAKGVCLASDVAGRKAVMKADLWNPDFAAVIDTTPGAPPPPPRA